MKSDNSSGDVQKQNPFLAAGTLSGFPPNDADVRASALPNQPRAAPLDRLPVGYVALDGTGCIQDVNRAAALLLERDPAELRTVAFRDLVAERDRDKFYSHLARCTRGDPQPVRTELTLNTSPEQIVELISSMQGSQEHGTVICHTVLHELTTLHTVLDEVRDSEERFRTLAESSFEGIVLSEQGRFVEVNRQFAQMLGYEPDELIGQEIASVIVPENRASVVENIMGGKDTMVEHGVICKDGRRIVVEAHGRSISYRGRKVRVTAIRDVTEQRHAQAALRRSELVYRAIGETIDFGVWICDPQGRNIYASPSFLALVGMTQEQCSEFGWGDVLHPDDAPATIAAWKECVSNGSFWERYHRFKGVDGRYHYILARGVPVRDDQGAIVCWAGINLDVDDIKVKEEALRQSEQRLRYHIENSPLAVVEWNRSFAVTRWSREAERMFGWKADEVIGSLIHDLPIVHREGMPVIQRTMERLSGGGERVVVSEDRNVTKDGRVIQCVWYNSVLTDAAGQVASIMSLVQDVTEERKARASLERTLQSVSVVVANSEESIVLVGDDGKIRCVSGRAAAALEATPSELEGKSCLDFVQHEQLIRARYYYADLVRDAEASLTTTFKLETLSGRVGWFTLSVSTVALGDSRGYLVRIERLGNLEEIASGSR